MANTFFDQLRDNVLQSSQHNTLEWYLSEVRRLTSQLMNDDKELQEGDEVQKTLQDIRNQDTSQPGDKDSQEARKNVEKYNVIETVSRPSQALIGKMILFNYDPKWKQQLPYYDRFPLVFFWRVSNSWALGMNMHYLPPYERARLMTSLYSLANSREPSVNTKLLLQYKVLKESSKYIYFKPCIKKYLYGHMRSRLMVIDPLKWNRTLFLPLAQFQKAPELRVWQDSIEIISKARTIHV